METIKLNTEHKITTLKIQNTPLQDQNLKTKILKVLNFNNSKYIYAKSNVYNQKNTIYQMTGNGLFDAFYAAYCLHGDVMISANDIWLAVSHRFCSTISENPEKYRDLFVTHQGKKLLSIEIDGTSPEWENFPCQSNRWDLAMEKFHRELGWATTGDISLIMRNDFNSSSFIEKAAANICLMSQMKHYFNYQLDLCGCGIQNVHFAGGVEDFEYLASKIVNLSKKYPLNNVFKSYLEKVLRIVNTFIDQMNNPTQVDLPFWNSIFQEKSISEEADSGYSINTIACFRGWITVFFGVDEIRKDNISEFSSSCPVQVNDHIKNKSYNMTFATDTKGFEEVSPNIFKPIVNIYVSS